MIEEIEKKIKDLAYERKISISRICKSIEISELGLKKMFVNKSLRIDILNKIANILGVPIAYFFDDPQKMNKVLVLFDSEIKKLKEELIIKNKLIQSYEYIFKQNKIKL